MPISRKEVEWKFSSLTETRDISYVLAEGTPVSPAFVCIMTLFLLFHLGCSHFVIVLIYFIIGFFTSSQSGDGKIILLIVNAFTSGGTKRRDLNSGGTLFES
jgi:hypothetical protein